MDDFNNEALEYMFIVFIVLIGFGMLVIAFLVNYYDLSRFKKCYDNDFKLSYCHKYKNY